MQQKIDFQVGMLLKKLRLFKRQLFEQFVKKLEMQNN